MPHTSFTSDIVAVNIPDNHGKTIQLSKIVDTGYLLPYFENCLDVLKSFPMVEARSDDVIVCGYPKCGTHWIWEIAGMLSAGNAKYVNSVKEQVMLEAIDIDILSSIPSPRVLNSHLPLDLLPPDFIAKQCKLILLLRHPKDVAVSLFNHVINLEPMYRYTGTWCGFLDLFNRGQVEYGSFFEYWRSWEADLESKQYLPIHLVRYEAMKVNPVDEITRLAKFLEIDEDQELFERIAAQTVFERMKEAKAALDDEYEKASWKDHRPMMYRKGEVGDWRNWFTVSQSEEFDEIFSREMLGSKIVFPTYGNNFVERQVP